MELRSLKAILKRVESWPEEAQQEAVASLLAIEDASEEAFKLSVEDQAAIDAGLADIKFDRVASDEEIDDLFGRFSHA